MKDILFLIFYLIFPKEYTYTKMYMIDTAHIPQYIYWIDSGNVLLSSYGYTEIFNTESRKSNTIDTCKECIYGFDNGFIYCKYEHRDIQSIDEFSTTITVYDINDSKIYSKDVFPTVIPTVCKRDSIILKNAYSFLEKKIYILDIKNDTFKEVNFTKEKELIDGYITVSKSKDLEKYIVLDEYYRLWVYKREVTKKKLL